MAINVYGDGNLYYHGKCCVFISHQQEDKTAAKLIANYLLYCGIDVYFDEYDRSINRSNPQSVVDAIEAGLQKSTHLMCLLSENSMSSKWIPWEVGYGYEHNVISTVKIQGRFAWEYLDMFFTKSLIKRIELRLFEFLSVKTLSKIFNGCRDFFSMRPNKNGLAICQ